MAGGAGPHVEDFSEFAFLPGAFETYRAAI